MCKSLRQLHRPHLPPPDAALFRSRLRNLSVSFARSKWKSLFATLLHSTIRCRNNLCKIIPNSSKSFAFIYFKNLSNMAFFEFGFPNRQLTHKMPFLKLMTFTTHINTHIHMHTPTPSTQSAIQGRERERERWERKRVLSLAIIFHFQRSRQSSLINSMIYKCMNWNMQCVRLVQSKREREKATSSRAREKKSSENQRNMKNFSANALHSCNHSFSMVKWHQAL